MQLRISFKCEAHLCSQVKYCENYQLIFASGAGEGVSGHVTIIYELHPTKKNGRKATDFFKEYLEIVNSVATNSVDLLIVGDFNIHLDCLSNSDTKQLSSILRSTNLA